MNLIDASLILDSPALRRSRDQLIRAHLYAGKIALTETTREAEQDIEGLIRQAVGGKLWRAIKSEVSPRGNRIARDPAGIIIVSGGARSHGAIKFLTGRGRVANDDGGWTAVPLPAAGKNFVGSGRTRQSLTPDMWEQRTGLRLRPVFRPGKLPLLVTDNAAIAAKNGVARASRVKRLGPAARGTVTVPIFILLPPRDFIGRVSTGSVLNRLPGRLKRAFEEQAALIDRVRAAV